jgi:anti-anti-sigma regulatory factor
MPPIDCDVSALTDADELALEALVRLQLTARRLGRSIRLCNASTQLVDLLALVGLTDVLPVVDATDDADAGDSGVEMNGQVEEREQVRVDEVVDRGDAAV